MMMANEEFAGCLQLLQVPLTFGSIHSSNSQAFTGPGSVKFY